MARRVDPATLEVLGRAKTNGHALTLTDSLEPAAYRRVASVIEAAGGRWDKRAKAHLFAEVLAQDALEQVLLTGLVTDEHQELGAFFTPPAVAELVIAAAEIEPGMEVLEPSAGRGALAALALSKGCRVECVEIDPRNVEMLHAIDFRRIVLADFLTEWPKPAYDRVVMNPPFARQHDIAHVTHALRFLKPGGRLVAIMSAGIGFRTNHRTEGFRRLVEAGAGSIVPLPDGSFKPSGTAVQTVLVTIEATAAVVAALTRI